MAYPDDELLDPQQRALLMPQPVQRFPTIRMPGEGTPVAPPVQPVGQPGTRPGEVQTAQTIYGKGPPTAPPPVTAPAPPSGGQFGPKAGKSGTGGAFVRSTTEKPKEPAYVPFSNKEGTFVWEEEPGKYGMKWNLKKLSDAPAGPKPPGQSYEEAGIVWMPDKEGIGQQIGIARTGPPGLFEFKGKLYMRHSEKPGDYTLHDPENERVVIPKELGGDGQTTLSRKELDALQKKRIEEGEARRAEREKFEYTAAEERRKATEAARIAERKSRRDADREVLKAGDKTVQTLGQQKAILEMAEGYLDAGMKTGKWEEASLPIRQLVRSLTGGKSEDIRQLDMQEAFQGFMNQQVALTRAGGPGDSNFSNADLLFAQGTSPGLGKGPAANRALAARQQQILDWRERQHKALKQFFNHPDNQDKGIEDFDPEAAGVHRVFPQWQNLDKKGYQKLRHGMVYIDRNGQYREVGPDRLPRLDDMDQNAYRALPKGTRFLDSDGVPRTKEDEASQ
jgi:hypothetical protein